MSGWITLTVELRDNEEYWNDHEEGVGDASKEAFMEYADSPVHYPDNETLQYFIGISEATNRRPESDTNHKYLMAVVGGRHDTSKVFEMLDSVVEYSTGRAVVIHANDTSDTGHAHLYALNDGEWAEVDAYEEDQSRDGTHIGMQAAAYMYAKYGIPAIAKRHMTYEHTEVDKYTGRTLHNRPR